MYTKPFLFLPDFPLIINHTRELKGSTVKVTWKQGLCPPHDMYVYYREVMSGINVSKWEAVNVSPCANHYNLKLKCFKQYDIAVTGWREVGTRKPRTVKTGQGEKI